MTDGDHATGDVEARLRARLAEVEDRLAAQRRAVEGIVESARDSNADDEHDPEGVTLSAEWSRLSALVDAAQSELRQVDDALARLDAGTYGVCANCGRRIPAARLKVRPFAELCVPCAEQAGQ